MDITSFSFFKKLKKLSYIEKIILFGSRSRGDAQERSDIDLAFFCPTATAKDWAEIMDILDEADTLLKIDAVRLDALGNASNLVSEIKNDGVILYEKK